MHTKEQLVTDLIANKAVQFTEEDRTWLETLEDAQLTKLSPVDNEDDDAPSGDVAAATIDADASDDTPSIQLTDVGSSVDDVDDAPVTTDDYIAAAPEELREVLNSGLTMHRARKKSLVDGLVANNRCKFTTAQLESKDIDELENLSLLAQVVSYEGSGANLSSGLRDNADTPPEPLKLFDLNKTADAA